MRFSEEENSTKTQRQVMWFEGNEHILQLIVEVIFFTVNTLKTTDFYTLIYSIIWCTNYMSIKLLQKWHHPTLFILFLSRLFNHLCVFKCISLKIHGQCIFEKPLINAKVKTDISWQIVSLSTNKTKTVNSILLKLL